MISEIIDIKYAFGFFHEIEVKYFPTLGYVDAIFEGRNISSLSFNKLHPPFTEDEREWEKYEQDLEDWIMEVKPYIISECKNYFNIKQFKL